MNNSEKFWDRQANSFDSPNEEPDSATLKTVERIKKYLNNNDSVLDYACGTGPMALALAEDVQEVYAIDISAKMLAVAKRKASERDIENIQFAQTTLFDERFSPESFDMVVAFNILHLLENPGDAILRISQFLKPGGVFVSSSACMGENKKIISLFLRAISKTGLVPKINAFSTSELENLISKGGFQIIESEISVRQVPEYFIIAKKGSL